jgi:molybdenum cofactor cytidylyltransferase
MIAAIILAAGQSKRMGQNKMLLPFGRSTVIETIVSEIIAAEVNDIVVVTGHERNNVEAALSNFPARCVFNPNYAASEMIVSIQVGLTALSDQTQAALIVLGDQPRIQRDVVRRVVAAYTPNVVVIPSYQHRRGHPILIDRVLWDEVLSLPAKSTLRDFIRAHANKLRYVEVDSNSVISDIDTLEDYQEAIQQ